MLRSNPVMSWATLCIATAAFSTPAWAKMLSLECSNNVLGNLSVNIDLDASNVTEGNPVVGPFPARISALVIAWTYPQNWVYTLDRTTGNLHAVLAPNASASYDYSCAQVASPTTRF